MPWTNSPTFDCWPGHFIRLLAGALGELIVATIIGLIVVVLVGLIAGAARLWMALPLDRSLGHSSDCSPAGALIGLIVGTLRIDGWHYCLIDGWGACWIGGWRRRLNDGWGLVRLMVVALVGLFVNAAT